MLTQSCETLTGVGPSLSNKLAKCKINTILDLIFHLPFRYQNRTKITAIKNLSPNIWSVISGTVCKVEVKTGKRMMLDCYVEDSTGIIKLRFFNFHRNQVAILKTSPLIRAFGEVKLFANQFEMVHPEYQIIQQNQPCVVEETLTPIYNSTQGLSQKQLRQLVKQALNNNQNEILQLEWMHEQQLRTHKIPTLHEAIKQLHNPSFNSGQEQLELGTHPALKRLAMDELIAHQLSMQLAREQREALTSHGMQENSQVLQDFLAKLPFQLTNAQYKVYKEISHDLTKLTPMLRLVQGDVGSGKTVVAAMAALTAITNGFQVALMAPTDLLSEQHACKISEWFQAINIKTYRLTGKMPIKQRRETLNALENGDAMFVVGTHALFQKAVKFKQLGLIIIDEQHRFGVEQRKLLQQKGQENYSPHQLLMTATPIPRTLSMTHLAHLDLSIIDELPPGRTPVVTVVMHESKREQIIQRLSSSLNTGQQAYWVCTLIDDSESLTCMAAIATANKLQEQLPAAKIGLIHGRLKSNEKDEIMTAFKNGEINLLVATTVIEVGVDVPNASLMIIDNAERLGLSQLHQLRGRVGRGSKQSHCLLIYQTPLSYHSKERLRVMRETCDGFIIAEKDLELRGPGDVLGTQQTGEQCFKIADIQRDKHLLPNIQNIAREIIHHQPQVAQKLVHRWLGNGIHFFQN